MVSLVAFQADGLVKAFPCIYRANSNTCFFSAIKPGVLCYCSLQYHIHNCWPVAGIHMGPETCHPIGREEKRSYCPPRRKREETQGKPRCCEAEEGGDVEGVTCGLYGVSASAGTDRPNGGGGVRQKKKIYIYHQPPLNATTASGKLQYITFVFGVRLQFKRKLYNAHNGRNMWVILTGTLDDLASIYSLETSDIVLSIFSKAVNTNEFQNTGNHI